MTRVLWYDFAPKAADAGKTEARTRWHQQAEQMKGGGLPCASATQNHTFNGALGVWDSDKLSVQRHFQGASPSPFFLAQPQAKRASA